MMKLKLFLTAIACLFAVQMSQAQCKIANTAFQGGEQLDYKLYFNWKFVWVAAGSATMSTQNTMWKGTPAYKSHLITHTSSRLDRFFRMRDTLQCTVSTDIVPLQYKKAADEGGRYYVDKVWYSYVGGKTHLRQECINGKGELKKKTTDTVACCYDMMSMMLRARSLDAKNYKPGDRIRFPMVDGSHTEDITLIYRGKENVLLKDNTEEYRCMKISFVEKPKGGGKEKEIITFFITDDENHVPVRLDMYLRFGTAKAYLEKSKGLRNPMKAKIK